MCIMNKAGSVYETNINLQLHKMMFSIQLILLYMRRLKKAHLSILSFTRSLLSMQEKPLHSLARVVLQLS